MSDSEGYEAVTVSEQGVTVTKRFEEDEFPVPAIAFEIVSDRDETVRLTITDDVPDGVEVEDLGFHPEYGSEYWTIDEDVITFEREFSANSEYTTVYGIRATGTDDVERFLEPPRIESVDPPLGPVGDDAAGDVLPEDGSDVVRDVIADETAVPPGLEEETDDEDEEVEPLELDDPADAGTTADRTGTTQGSGSDEPSADGSLVASIAAELRNGDVAAEDVKLLREAMEIAGERGGSVTARVDRIQRDVSNLRAYTDALEEFLDEHGTAEEVVEDFRSDVESFEDTIASVESTVDSHDDSLETVEDELEAVRTGVEDLESSLAALESDVDQLQSQLGEKDVSDRIEALEADLDDLQSWQSQIKQTFGGE